MNTFVYKAIQQPSQAGLLQLRVDVHSPSQALRADSPVLVYFHSGGLTAGSRHLNEWFPHWLLDEALQFGFTVLIPDYSLLCPGSAHDILDDVVTLGSWIRASLNVALAGVGLPPARTDDLAVVGQSAGGYLTYLMAAHLKPPPKTVVVFYGMGGNFLSDHHVTRKSEQFQHWMPFHQDPTPFRPLETATRTAGIVVETETSDVTRVGLFSWLLQNATFLDVLLETPGLSAKLQGVDEERRPEMLPPTLRPLIPSLCISRVFPPTYLIHGARDSAVLVEESRNIADLLNKTGVDHVYREFAELEHGFDWRDKECRRDLEDLFPFVLRHLGR